MLAVLNFVFVLNYSWQSLGALCGLVIEPRSNVCKAVLNLLHRLLLSPLLFGVLLA